MSKLKVMCHFIAYMNLLSGIIDIAYHLLVVCTVSDGFQCDIAPQNFQRVYWFWLQPIMLFANLGLHGFYPFPNDYSEYLALPANGQPRCYPGMLHVRMADVLNLTINAIWLRFVISFVVAVHKQDLLTMRRFLRISMVKLAVHIMLFTNVPDIPGLSYGKIFWFFKGLDICVAVFYLVMIKHYMIVSTQLIMTQVGDQPPSYFECLMGTAQTAPSKQDDKDQIAITVMDCKETKTDEKKEVL